MNAGRLHPWSPSMVTDLSGQVTLANAISSLFHKRKKKTSFYALTGYVTDILGRSYRFDMKHLCYLTPFMVIRYIILMCG